ncbi:Response regulatory domain-containing protein [Pararobbsia alpina]|uniref:hypothetical protein n=1 Tax=Pararobbsia alpina TaxID=621374 RepID=UPI0039A5FC17
MDHTTYEVHVTQATHAGIPWHEFIPILPSLIWLLIVIVLLFWLGDWGLKQFLSRATKIGVAGLEIELSTGVHEAALAQGVELPEHERDRIVRRLENAKPYFERARFLWIDSAPENNRNEIQVLISLGSIVDLAINDHIALHQLQTGVYDVVLSNMSRGGNRDAGLALITPIRTAMLGPTLIFYVGDPTRVRPPGAFGMTTAPDELFHLIIDALERRRV